MAKVSIIMPACNVENFIEECMDSIIHQTLEDIEIICVDDGSTDTTGKILDTYASKDKRIKVIHKENSGYGNSMNIGLDNASGEYIGIIETDDFADPDMFEKLYAVAKQNDADVVKSNYYTYVSKPEPTSTFLEVLAPFEKYNTIFCPLEFQDIYRVKPCIWTGLYRRSMIIEHAIRFNETPGASYQDTSFAFKIWTSANRVILVKDAYLHYRTDNSNSSVKSSAKIFCLCDEYAEMDRFLEMNQDKKEKLQKIKTYLKYESYRWNYERLAIEFKYCFLLKMKEELSAAEKEGNLDSSLFKDFQWIKLSKILNDTDTFFKESCIKELGGNASVQDLVNENKNLKTENKRLKKFNEELKKSTSYRLGKKLTYIPGKVKNLLKGAR